MVRVLMSLSVQNSQGEARSKPLWRDILLCLGLLAFSLQTYIGLTHMHAQAPAHATQVSLPSDNAPGHEPADCPICTHIQLAGHFLLPGDVAATAATLAVQVVTLAASPAIFPATVSHIWRGRGPPRI